MALSERERALLDFEGRWWQQQGSKEAAIRDQLDLSSARYYRLLGDLVASDEALVFAPLVVRRLRRDKARRRRARYEGHPAEGGPWR